MGGVLEYNPHIAVQTPITVPQPSKIKMYTPTFKNMETYAINKG